MVVDKFALVHFGNEESYGLLFAGEEFKNRGDIRFFDAEMEDPTNNIIDYQPNYLCFSPMTTFYERAKEIEKAVKESIDTVSIYGGHHATNCWCDCGDTTVVGSVHGIDLNRRGIVFGGPTLPENLKSPARTEYSRDIPRMETRYRKVMLSVTGCPFSCTYCSSSNSKFFEMYGPNKCHLRHRRTEDIFNEAMFLKGNTHEIEWVDDDIFYGDQDWLISFFEKWNKEIGIPMYVSTTSLNALKASDKLLKVMRSSVNCIGMGVQAIRPESRKILGRAWDSEEKLTEAYNRLVHYGYRINLQCIVGLPISDPVQDGLDTIDGMRRIGPGSIISCYPLQIYPNTKMLEYCKERGYKLNENSGDTNSGMPGIDFGYQTNNKIRNLCKLATMAVKFNISRDWLESMLDVYLCESSKPMSMVRYYECIKDRLPEKADKIYGNIIGGMNVRY